MLTILANIVAFFLAGSVLELYGPFAGLGVYLVAAVAGTAVSIELEVAVQGIISALRQKGAVEASVIQPESHPVPAPSGSPY